MAIKQVNTGNTFQQWLIATQELITVANNLTDGNGATFVANTKLEVSGTGAILNVRTSADINVLYANSATLGNVTITGNVASLNVTTDAWIGDDLWVYGDTNITGNLYVGGNIQLDAIGFNDLEVSGNITFGGTITGNNANLRDITANTINVSNNARVGTTLNVGSDLYVGGNTIINGDLTVRGNTNLDNINANTIYFQTLEGKPNSVMNVVNVNVSNNANIERITGNSVFQFEPAGQAIVMAIALG
jgi:predicted acyltransferase (DUF342 family)